MEMPDYLESLEKDLKLYKESIREASETIIQDGVSDYPVFIMHKVPVPIGELILNADELDTEWSVSATTAEDLIKAGIIQIEKAKQFIATYKPATEQMCLLVIPDYKRANFVFIPY
jgi:hypothetical protein